MRRQKRGKARTFTVECKAVARMSDIHDAFGATDPAHRRRRVGCGRKARGKSRNFTRKCGFVDRPDRRAERVLREEMLDVGEQQFRSEEHTSELQSLMRISYAVFCLKKKNTAT